MFPGDASKDRTDRWYHKCESTEFGSLWIGLDEKMCPYCQRHWTDAEDLPIEFRKACEVPVAVLGVER